MASSLPCANEAARWCLALPASDGMIPPPAGFAISQVESRSESERVVPDVIEQIELVSREAHAELGALNSSDQLEQFRIKFLGTKGKLKDLMSLLAQVPKDQKREIGQRVNAVKDQVTAAC